MRHRTALAARGLLVLTLGAGLSYAGMRAADAAPVKVSGTVDNKFDPADVTATLDATGKVTIDFTSHGAHTMTSDAPDAKFDSGNVADGQTKTITFAAKAGTYDFYCLYHKTLGMVGKLTVKAAGAATSSNPEASPSGTGAALPPASASASASVGTVEEGEAPTPGTEAEGEIPGIKGNKELEALDEERAAQHGAVSGFRFFTMVAVAFLVILGAAVLFSTRPRRAGR